MRDVSADEKRQVYASYGIKTHSAGQYEVDHLIPLGLGGSNDIKNLWPEPAEPRPGFHEKDMLEYTRHNLVCSGKLPLADAQKAQSLPTGTTPTPTTSSASDASVLTHG